MDIKKEMKQEKEKLFFSSCSMNIRSFLMLYFLPLLVYQLLSCLFSIVKLKEHLHKCDVISPTDWLTEENEASDSVVDLFLHNFVILFFFMM